MENLLKIIRNVVNVKATLESFLAQDGILGCNPEIIFQFLSAISIYTKGGLPVWSNSRTLKESEGDMLDGGFYAAILAMASISMGNTRVKLSGTDDESFLIVSGEKFLGTFHKKGGISFSNEEAECILDSILQYLSNQQQLTVFTPILTDTSIMETMI